MRASRRGFASHSIPSATTPEVSADTKTVFAQSCTSYMMTDVELLEIPLAELKGGLRRPRAFRSELLQGLQGGAQVDSGLAVGQRRSHLRTSRRPNRMTCEKVG